MQAYDRSMSTAPDIADVRVVPVDTPELAAAVRALRADPAQYAFVGDVAANLVEAEAAPHSEAMAILSGNQVVGFYRIDLRPGAFAGHDYGEACASLHSLLIDRAQQGRGLGARALEACCTDLEHRHPGLRLLALTVNCVNLGAIRAYQRAGFVNGGLYFGGSAGPQHLMLRRLGR
jgi:RimJ/RimL family protein N-acetyltransferase